MDYSKFVPYLHLAIEAVGGAAVVYQGLTKGALYAAPHLVDFALDRAFSHPKVGAALVKFRPQIEDFFDAADAQVKARLDAAAAASGAAPKS
jgi:hypothetical protein